MAGVMPYLWWMGNNHGVVWVDLGQNDRLGGEGGSLKAWAAGVET